MARSEHFALHRSTLPIQLVIGPESKSKEPKAICPLFSPTDDLWIGAMVPKRWAKRAVTRNTIRRQIYALAAHRTWPLPASDRVIRLRKAFDTQVFGSAASLALKAAVRLELQTLFDKAQHTS